MGVVVARYEEMLASGELRPDPDQRGTIEQLDALASALVEQPAKGSLLWRMLGRGPAPAPARGLYMWGGVGRGKSMLMDLFYDCVPIESKRRVHFHEFMLEVHDRLRVERVKEKGDPIPPVVEALAAQARLLAFD